VLSQSGWQYFTTDGALLHANINAILPLSDGSMLCGGGLYTKGGGTYFTNSGGKWNPVSFLTKKDGLAGDKIRSLFEDGEHESGSVRNMTGSRS
jgi:hypothetical protein